MRIERSRIEIKSTYLEQVDSSAFGSGHRVAVSDSSSHFWIDPHELILLLKKGLVSLSDAAFTPIDERLAHNGVNNSADVIAVQLRKLMLAIRQSILDRLVLETPLKHVLNVEALELWCVVGLNLRATNPGLFLCLESSQMPDGHRWLFVQIELQFALEESVDLYERSR